MEASQSKSLAAQAGPLLAYFFIQMKDLRQTPQYARYMELLGWQALRLNLESSIWNLVYVKRLPLIGNVDKLQRPVVLPTEKELDSFAKKHRIGVLYVEPQIQDSKFYIPSFASAKSSFLPAKTIQIDLTKSEKELLSEMHPKTRYNIKVAQKRGVEINESRDIESFVTLWHSSARRRGMFLSQKKEIQSLFHAFGSRAHLLLACPLPTTHYPHPVAGVLLVRTATTAYYMYAASTKSGNKLFAPTLLAWEAIRLAKKRGCKIFDFEGIYDERYSQTKNWKGFTRFKEGFGGKVITYPGTFVKYYNPLAKLLRL